MLHVCRQVSLRLCLNAPGFPPCPLLPPERALVRIRQPSLEAPYYRKARCSASCNRYPLFRAWADIDMRRI